MRSTAPIESSGLARVWLLRTLYTAPGILSSPRRKRTMVSLPRADELARVPLRAMVAYAVRAARRVFPVLAESGVEENTENGLMFAELVVSNAQIHEIDLVRPLRTFAKLAEAKCIRSPEDAIAAQCVRSAIWAAYNSVEYMKATNRQEHSRAVTFAERTAVAAARAGRQVVALEEPIRSNAISATIRDYENLRDLFGESDEVRLGEPIDLKGDSVLGPLT